MTGKLQKKYNLVSKTMLFSKIYGNFMKSFTEMAPHDERTCECNLPLGWLFKG